MGAERRRFPRVHPTSSAPIEVQLMGTDFLEVLTAFDISIGGLCIILPQGFSESDLAEEITVIIKLPRERPFTVKGKIRHRSFSGRVGMFGVQFTSVKDEAKKKISTYVDQRLGRKAS